MEGLEMRLEKNEFSLIELLVVIAIIAILVSMLMPALRKARESAQTIQCRSNLKNIGLATHNYLNENDGWFPTYYYLSGGAPAFWFQFIGSSLGEKNYSCSARIWACPANPNNGLKAWNYTNLPYGYNAALGYYDRTGGIGDSGTRQKVRVNEVKHPSELIVAGDSDGDKYYDSMFGAAGMIPGNWHRNGANIVFVDNHVDWRKTISLIKNPNWTNDLFMMWGNYGYYRK